jgi:hypothetical protein
MIKSKINIFVISVIFIVTEIILGILVQHTAGITNTIVSYSTVLLACIFCLLMFTKTCNFAFTELGLIFTACADIFLVVIEPMKQIPAMIFFTATQLCYFAITYINESGRKKRRANVIARTVLSAVMIGAALVILGEKTDALALISVFYYANLVVNIIFAFGQLRRSFLFPLGLLLFAFCDAQIGIRVLVESYITVDTESLLYQFAYPSVNFAWMCYVPSQTLIALSVVKSAFKGISHKNRALDKKAKKAL